MIKYKTKRGHSLYKFMKPDKGMPSSLKEVGYRYGLITGYEVWRFDSLAKNALRKEYLHCTCAYRKEAWEIARMLNSAEKEES